MGWKSRGARRVRWTVASAAHPDGLGGESGIRDVADLVVMSYWDLSPLKRKRQFEAEGERKQVEGSAGCREGYIWKRRTIRGPGQGSSGEGRQGCSNGPPWSRFLAGASRRRARWARRWLGWRWWRSLALAQVQQHSIGGFGSAFAWAAAESRRARSSLAGEALRAVRPSV